MTQNHSPLRSFRLKTVVFTIVLSGLLLSLFGWYGWKWIEQRSLDALDSRILVPGQRIVEYHGWATDWQRFNESIVAAFGEDWKNDRILLVRSNMYDRKTLFHSENWPESLEFKDVPDIGEAAKKVRMVRDANEKGFIRYELIAQPYFYSTQAGGKQWRMVTLSNPEITFYIGINQHRYQAEIRQLRIYYFGAIILLLAAIGGGAYWIASRAMHPIRIITHTTREISSKELNQRIPDNQQFDSEFDELIQTINDMLERLDISFHQAMRFSADASHELKTPIANIQNELTSRLQKCIPDSEEHATLNEILNELERLKRIMRSLFLFSQADAGKMVISATEFNLSELLDSLVKDTEILAEEAFQLQLEQQIQPEVCIHGDPIMLGQVIQNLLNNAIIHNLEGGWIRVTLTADSERIHLTVENSATPIPEQEQDAIFLRFQRGSLTRKNHTPGLGLGLSLASEILRAHTGNISLTKSDAVSTCFSVILPRIICSDLT